MIVCAPNYTQRRNVRQPRMNSLPLPRLSRQTNLKYGRAALPTIVPSNNLPSLQVGVRTGAVAQWPCARPPTVVPIARQKTHTAGDCLQPLPS